MWLFTAILSAFFAGITSILAKCGIKKTDSDAATAIRTAIVYHGRNYRLRKNPPCNQPKIPALPAFLRDGNGRVLDLLLQGALPRQCEQGCTDRQI